MQEEILRRLQHQHKFLVEGKGHFMVFAEFTEDRHVDPPYEIPGQTGVLSEDFLKNHAYDLGIQAIRRIKTAFKNQMEIGDDSVPYPSYAGFTVDWGTGATAALFSNGDVVFQEETSYSSRPIIKDWADLDDLVLSCDNRWFDYELQFWRGVLSEYEDTFPLVTHNYRSPLDYANDYRGTNIFLDLYDHPEEVKRLVDMCTEAIITCDKRIRDELPEMRSIPGGAWGVGIPAPGMIFLNGDPVDLISNEQGEEFNTPYVERIIEYSGSLYFHHHSIGVSRASSVAKIKGLTVQQIHQDPNGPKLCDYIDDNLIQASLKVPIDLGTPLNIQAKDFEATLEKLSHGRFIVRVQAPTRHEVKELIKKIRSYS